MILRSGNIIFILNLIQMISSQCHRHLMDPETNSHLHLDDVIQISFNKKPSDLIIALSCHTDQIDENPGNFKALKIRHAPNGTLQANVFSKHNSFEILELQGIGLESLNGRVFANLQHLRILDISRNSISDLGEEFFIGSNNSSKFIEKIDLSYNQISRLNMKGPLNTIHLDFSNNNISSLSNWNFPNLKFLNLSANAFTEIEYNFSCTVGQLEILDLSGNDIRGIEIGSFRCFKFLQSLDLSFNQLRTLPPGTFGGLINLRALHLNNNQLINLYALTFQEFFNLKEVYLHGNNLDQISNKFLNQLSYLETISLHDNRISCYYLDIIITSIKARDIGILTGSDYSTQNMIGIKCY